MLYAAKLTSLIALGAKILKHDTCIAERNKLCAEPKSLLTKATIVFGCNVAT
jgi:hypothetical protein